MLPTIHIIYASTSGNVEAVVERTSEVLNKAGYPTNMNRAGQTDLSLIQKNTLFIFATSTWEHGVINPYFDELLKGISHSDMKEKSAAMIGLGDTRYEPVLFCAGIEELKNAFIKSGGDQIGTTLKINGNPYEVLDSIVTDWTNQLISQLRHDVR